MSDQSKQLDQARANDASRFAKPNQEVENTITARRERYLSMGDSVIDETVDPWGG